MVFVNKTPLFRKFTQMIKLLIVDNQRASRNSLFELLKGEGYNVTACDCAEGCLAELGKTTFDLILYSSTLPVLDGLAFTSYIKERGIDTPVLMMVPDQVELSMVVQYIKGGAEDVLQRPINITQLLINIRKLLKRSKSTKSLKNTPASSCKNRRAIPEIAGNHSKIQAIKSTIKKLSNSDARVLITGANGTGKELVAHWLHASSRRSNAPIIEVNCAAIPNDLIESALFGHEKGAFTGADAKYIGRFEQANGGTLFLDEIGDMALSAQAKVLRALQESKIGRVGGGKEIDVDVRVIAATNKNLKEEIIKGNFREDLYHRLNVIPIHVPSLCERKEDIPELVNHFVSSFCVKQQSPIKEITSEAMQALINRPWTGNIRELQNVIERLVILCDDSITQKDIECYCFD